MLDLFEIIGSLNIVNNWHYAKIYRDRHRKLVIARNEAIHYGATRTELHGHNHTHTIEYHQGFAGLLHGTDCFLPRNGGSLVPA